MHDGETRCSQWARPYCLYAALYIVLFLALGQAPWFDYHRLLLPSAERAEVLCTLRGITCDANSEIAEHAVGYTRRDTVILHLYATVVTRTMTCRYTMRGDDDDDDGPPIDMVLHYVAHYLNISHVDVEHQVAMARQRYSEPVRMWRYNSEDYVYLLRDQPLDRHGLAEQPIDRYKDWVGAFLVAKGALALVTTTAVALTLALASLYARHRFTLAALLAPRRPTSAL
jgi:hypothetical protein